MSGELVTIVMFGGMLLLMICGLPIAFALGGVSLVTALFIWGPKGLSMGLFGTTGIMVMYPLACAPMFMFMGILLSSSGIVEDVFRTIQNWLGAIPGSLAMATVGVSTILAAMVGDITAATLTMGAIALPIMIKLKYNKTISIGSIQAGAALGFLIPPSIITVLYALISKQSIGQLFAGGLIPGVMLSTMYIIYILVRCYFQPHLGSPVSKAERPPLAVKVKSLVSILLPLVVILSVISTIFLGLATPVESSAIGALGAVIATAIKRRLTWDVVRKALEASVSITGMITWIFMGALTFGKIYDALGARDVVEPFIFSLGLGRWGIMIMMMVSWFIMGMFLDDTAILFICLPIYLPIIQELGFDPIWFGILYLLNMQMAYLTPPFGYCLFMMKAVAPPDISMIDIYKSTTPFVLIQALGLVFVIIFPGLALWLPRVLFK